MICTLLLAACQSGAQEPAAPPRGDSVSNAASPGNAASPIPANPDGPVSSDDPPAAPRPDAPTPDCPVTSSTDWHAHVDALPGPNRHPRLIVSGKATVPTGGYRLSLRMGEVAESYPVQVTVYLDVARPSGGATQAVATHDVRGSWRSEERVGSVTVRCGSRMLAGIGNIEIAR